MREKPIDPKLIETSPVKGWPNILQPRKALKLTHQEVIILNMLLEGKNFLEISQELKISHDMVMVHAFHIRKKAENES